MTCSTLQGKYAEKLEEERNKLNETIETLYKKLDAQDKIIDEQALEKAQLQQRIDKAIEYIKRTIKIIKEQPSSCELNDIWVLEHLNSFLEILGDKK